MKEKMKLHRKSEWFEFSSPIGEPNINWDNNKPYLIERIVKENGTVIWFGCSVNWKKELNKSWKVLTVNKDIKPNSEGIYLSGRLYFAPCDIPIYEKLYNKRT
jgi:hypothetical protein